MGPYILYEMTEGLISCGGKYFLKFPK